MARSHARIVTEIWHDEDWLALSWPAQWAYEMILTQSGLSMCGVISYTPRRWVRFAKGMTVRKIEAAFDELREARFVIVDDDTEELLVRTFARNDGVLKSKNLIISMWRAAADVVSGPIRAAFVEGLPEGFRDYLREAFPKGLPEGLTEPLGEPPSAASKWREPTPLPTTTALPTTTPVAAGTLHGTEESTTDVVAPLPVTDFDEFWSVYPRREAKGAAAKAWPAACRKAEPETIIAGARRFRDDPNRQAAFTPHPQTWLNAERWTDAPLPPRGPTTASERSQRNIDAVFDEMPGGPNGSTRGEEVAHAHARQLPPA